MKPDEAGNDELSSGLEWVSLDQAEIDVCETEAEAQRLVDLLAWVLREVAAPANLADPSNWPPDLWIGDWPETWEAAFRDPILFDLARHQVAADLMAEPARHLTPIQEANLPRQAAILLSTNRPALHGKRRGKRAVEFLTLRIAEWTKRHDPRGEGPIAAAKLATAICESLTAHPLLSDLPQAVRTAEAIRADLGRLGVGS